MTTSVLELFTQEWDPFFGLLCGVDNAPAQLLEQGTQHPVELCCQAPSCWVVAALGTKVLSGLLFKVVTEEHLAEDGQVLMECLGRTGEIVVFVLASEYFVTHCGLVYIKDAAVLGRESCFRIVHGVPVMA